MTVHTILPRGIRNNNPLNIRLDRDNRWQGKVPPKHNSDGAFEQFQDPIMGLRAAAVLLIAHYDRRHLDTIRKLVGVWAPPNENDTEAYARCVAEESGFGIDDPLDLHDHACLRPILTAMIRVENGRQPYTDAQIDAALVRAGVMPPDRSLQQTRTVKGGQVAAAGTIGAGAIAANRLTVTYAKALLAATPKEQLAEPEKPKSISGVSAEAIVRMEQEMDHLQRDYRLVEDGYGTTMLNLVVAKGYVGRLLANDEVARYLERNHLDMKRELEGIIAAIRTDAVG